MDRKRIGLNRVTAPTLGLADFYALAASLGLGKVEIRNDLGKKDPIDGLAPSEASRLAADHGIQVLTINAVQKFNLAAARAEAAAELERLLGLAHAIACKAIVLCPNNDAEDARPADRRLAETVEALAAFGPMFQAAGVLGYLEPLGFSISSLSSLLVAAEAIARSGFSCYRLVYDTFHHHIGPDEADVVGTKYDIALTGLVHVSGVEAPIPTDAYRDEHRILPGAGDSMSSKAQIARLERLGYRGDFSYEVFSPEIQRLDRAELAAALRASLDYLLA